MPQTASLHIQARETDPIRVVELNGYSTRIGRATFCDVRLPDATLSDEVCRIRFRSGAWQIIPIGPKGAVWLDGEVLDQPRALAFDATFRVGSQWITLREHEDPTPTVGHWSARRGDWIPSHSHSPASAIEPLTAPIPADLLGSEVATRHRSDWDSHAVDHGRLIQNRREAKRWESRMKAAGEKLRAGTVATATPAPLRISVSEPRKTPLRREPLARRLEISPLRTPRVPKVGHDLIERTSWREKPTPRTQKVSTPEVDSPGRALVEIPEVKAPSICPESFVESDAFAREIEAISALSNQTRNAPFADVEIIGNEIDFPGIDGQTVEIVLPESMVRCDLAEDATWSAQRVLPETNLAPHDLGLPDSHLDNALDPLFGSVHSAGHISSGHEMEDVLRSHPSTNTHSEGLTAPLPSPDLEFVSVSIDAEDSDERDDEPRSGMRLGSAKQVTVAEHSIFELEPDPDPEEWADPSRFVTHTYLGEPVGSINNHAPIVHETSTHREDKPFSPFPSDGRENVATSPFAPSREWPRVNDLLAAQGVRSRPITTDRPSRKIAASPVPTDLKEPETWSLPLWFGWTPVAAMVLLMSAAGLFAGWTWANDDYQAGIIFARLAIESGKPEPLPDGVAPASGSWWRTNAANLVAWAAFNDLERPAGSNQSDESRALLERATQASPLDPTVRHALSLQTREGEKAVPLARVLGQSRDVLTLAAAGRRLLVEGKQAEALELYHNALAMAAQPALAHASAPLYLDDPETARYGLPGEDRIRPIVREMAESKAWTYQDWSKAIPDEPLARVATARVLRERGDPSAQLALDVAFTEPETIESLSAAEIANRLAASAEALALRGNWTDARERYRQAIALTPIDVVRRAWWLNVAAFSLRLNEETERQKGLEAAKNPDPNDDVTQRVVEIQKKMGYVAPRTAARVAGAREVNPPGPARK